MIMKFFAALLATAVACVAVNAQRSSKPAAKASNTPPSYSDNGRLS